MPQEEKNHRMFYSIFEDSNGREREHWLPKSKTYREARKEVKEVYTNHYANSHYAKRVTILSVVDDDVPVT